MPGERFHGGSSKPPVLEVLLPEWPLCWHSQSHPRGQAFWTTLVGANGCLLEPARGFARTTSERNSIAIPIHYFFQETIPMPGVSCPIRLRVDPTIGPARGCARMVQLSPQVAGNISDAVSGPYRSL